MTERSDLLSSIAETVADYRLGVLVACTPKRVNRWVSQFDPAAQFPILREMDHVLKRTYFSRDKAKELMSRLFRTERLVGDDPCRFWRGVRFLDIQGGGASQRAMLALFSKVLERECGFTVDDCGAEPCAYVYLDDASFSGNRLKHDLEAWVADDAPTEATVYIITIALHRYGRYYANREIHKAARSAGKSINLTWLRALYLEDRRAYTDSSDVLRPVSIPDDPAVQDYVAAMTHQPRLRTAGGVGGNSLFSSDTGRQTLEKEFLKAGVHIRQTSPNLNEYQRPLGSSGLETLGFGSLIVTFRNCPNNAPLALWAGDPWFPLFPRLTNAQTSRRRSMEMQTKKRS